MDHYREDGTARNEELEKLSKLGMEVSRTRNKRAACVAGKAAHSIGKIIIRNNVFMKTVRDHKDILLTLQPRQQPNL